MSVPRVAMEQLHDRSLLTQEVFYLLDILLFSFFKKWAIPGHFLFVFIRSKEFFYIKTVGFELGSSE